MLAMEHLDPTEADVKQSLYQLREFRGGAPQPHGMREGRNTAAVANSLDAFLERWLVAIYRGLRVVRQIDVECLLDSRHVSPIEQDLRDAGAPHLVASVDFVALEPA